MGSVNNTNFNIDQTVRVFDTFYDYDVNVPAAEYDIVYTFFLQQTKDANIAGNFTSNLFRVAEQTNQNVLTLLESLKGLDGLNLTVNMAYYLNNIRSNATLLGISAPVQANFYAARAVIQ